MLTFLFTDIEGSTGLWEHEPARMPQALAAHDALAQAAVLGQGGRVVKSTGDGIHAVFEDAAAAVAAALQLQLALGDPAATAGLPLRVRCGLHLGAPERRDGDYFGPSVNRAARIMSAAHGGQTLLSQAVAERVAGRLPKEATLHDLGRVRLRGLATAETVLQLQHPQLRAQFPPLRELEATPHNLAQPLNSFVGRERELAEAKALLAKSRLLTLLGMGGIGKSRLSLQLAAEVLDQHPDGVWLVELAPLSDARLLPQVVAAVLGLKEQAGQDVIETLLSHVRDRRLLLILDNCEHLVQACAALAKQLLQAGAGLKVLASSRDALQLAGEVCYAVPTLSAPAGAPGLTPEVLLQHEAVRLFVDRAAAIHPGFALTAGNAAAVADICQRLDGIPLAIELAAARTRALSVQAIAERLHDRFRLLVTTDQTVLPRQRTLRALIDWSYDLLSEAERMLFRRLAVFAGGWTLPAAESVCAGGSLPSADVLDLLARLVDKSLVAMDPGDGRYRMLETVRHYAQERLDEAGEGDAVRTCQLAFYLAFAETARPALTGPDQGLWLARLDQDRENLRLAHAWSGRAPATERLGLRLVHALRPYWISRGTLTVGLQLAQEVLARPTLQARDEARCMALFAAGQLSNFMGRHEAADAYLLECLAIARETDNAAVVARVLQPLGISSRAQGDFAAASRYLDEALALAREQGNLRELAAALNALAMLHRMQGRLDLAEPLCVSMIETARAIGDQEFIGIGLVNLAMVLIAGNAPGSSACAAGVRPVLVEVTELAEQTGSLHMHHSAVLACAGYAAALRRWSDAALFYGAAQAQQATAALSRDPADETLLESLIGAAASALGAEDFGKFVGAGRGQPALVEPAAMRAWLVGAAAPAP